MIDIKLLRENPQAVKDAVGKKKFSCDIDSLINLDEQRRSKLTKAETARAEQKAANKEMASMEKGSDAFQAKLKEMKALAAEVKALEKDAQVLDTQFKDALLEIPNIPHDSVPLGKGEDENVEHSTWGDIKSCSPHAMPHYDIPWFEQGVDFARGVKATGAGFPFYSGGVARLLRSLIQFCLQEANSNGYKEVWPPLMVNAESATATGQLPDKEGQMYVCESEGLYLIPTAEVPVTNFFRDEILDESALPVKICAYTPCFRREAGSWGKDVRGLNRLHQFDKVELVIWSHPDSSFDQLELLRTDAARLLEKLELPHRTLLMCSGDIGFPHAKQYDIEVWAAGQERWLEVSSCSCFTDFQARRANIRFRPDDGGKPQTVHTLNGSGLGLPRVLAAILENNLQEDGRIKIPSALTALYGGEYLGPSDL